MEIIAVVDEGLGNSSYFVDLGKGKGLVIDPSRDPSPYLRLMQTRDLKIEASFETHLHADFISGSRELEAVTGAAIVAPAAGELEYPHVGLNAGDTFDAGNALVETIASPGHTPEHLSYLLRMNKSPVALFTGGALIVGGVARTDLISPDLTEPLARDLFRTVRENFDSLPDRLMVYPTHGAGSFCSTASGVTRVTTLGAERMENPLFTSRDEDAFVEWLVGGYGSYPTYFSRLREVNRHGPRTYGEFPILPRLDAHRFAEIGRNGGVIIDIRPIERFAAGHIPGSISIALRPAFASWLGWLIANDRPLGFVLDHDLDREELVRQCLKVGYENLAGELEGGMEAWRQAGLPESRIDLVAPEEVRGTILDVRQNSEFNTSHIPEALHIELGALGRARESIPNGPVTTMCAHGERAMSAASLLEAMGKSDLAVLVGGPAEWRDSTGRSLVSA